MSQELVTSATDIELIATAMLAEHGDLAKASRHDTVMYNAMALRKLVASEPAIRSRYQELLAEELESSGLHIAERILVIKKLQDIAFGDLEKMIPPDPKVILDCSKEISRLIAESKGVNISGKSAIAIVSKEDASEILGAFLES